MKKNQGDSGHSNDIRLTVRTQIEDANYKLNADFELTDFELAELGGLVAANTIIEFLLIGWASGGFDE